MILTKGQGAIEYLLIIGAAVIIAVIVIALMMGLGGQGTGAVEEAGVGSEYSKGLIQAKSCTKLPFIEDDHMGSNHSDRIPKNYSYYLGFTADQIMTEYYYDNTPNVYIENNVFVGNGPMIPKNIAANDSKMLDYIEAAIRNKDISILINGKDALSQGYEVKVFRLGEPDLTITNTKMIAVYYAIDEIYTWIVVDEGLGKNWTAYGYHAKAKVELCYLDKVI